MSNRFALSHSSRASSPASSIHSRGESKTTRSIRCWSWLGLRASDASAEAATLSGALTTGAAVAASLVELSDDLVRAVAQDDTNTQLPPQPWCCSNTSTPWSRRCVI